MSAGVKWKKLVDLGEEEAQALESALRRRKVRFMFPRTIVAGHKVRFMVREKDLCYAQSLLQVIIEAHQPEPPEAA